ncbi:MFS transporter [Jatrophihabitans sp. DSM 45814]
MTDRTIARTSGKPKSIFSSAYRISTLGIIILMTIIAFEAMAVATALPTAASDLHGLGSYGWSFTGFLVASVVGMVSSGMYSDLRGPRMPLLVGLLLFVVGLVIGGLAGSMTILVGARVVQGLAVGLLITAMYVVMGEAYPDEIRPRIFAALSSAWIVPGLVGPVIAGWITEHFSWRWVFGGLAPFVVVGGLMLVPSLRQLRVHASHADHQRFQNPSRIGYAILTAIGIAGIANIGENQRPASVALAVAGIALLVLGLRRLLPSGTISFAAGVPAAVAFRGVLAGTFFGMESIVPLTLKVQHHYSPTLAGAPLMLSAVTWALGSQVQSRSKRLSRPFLVGCGLVLMAAAGIGMAATAAEVVPGWAAFLAWPLAGLGAGFALTTASVSMLEFTNDADRGSDSASLQLADSSCSALCTAFSGALVAAGAHGKIDYGSGLSIVFLVLSGAGLLAIVRAARLRPADRGPRADRNSAGPASRSASVAQGRHASAVGSNAVSP